jgi:hypothetical protein
LDANPLEDIRNTQRLHAVILGGRLIPKSGLEALLNRAESNRWRANPAAITLIRLVAYMMRYLLYAVLFALLTVSFGVYRFIRRPPPRTRSGLNYNKPPNGHAIARVHRP